MNIKYKKGDTNNVAECLIQPLVMVLITVLDPCGHDTSGWLHLYKSDLEFGTTYQILLEGKRFLDFHLHNTLLCHLGHLCVPSSECTNMIWEAYYNQVTGMFGLEKMATMLQKYFLLVEPSIG